MAERVTPPHFDLEDSKVEVNLGEYIAMEVKASRSVQQSHDISMQVKEPQDDMKSFVTLHFEKLGREIGDSLGSLGSLAKDLAEINNTLIWWTKPVTALLAVIATAVVVQIVQQLVPYWRVFQR